MGSSPHRTAQQWLAVVPGLDLEVVEHFLWDVGLHGLGVAEDVDFLGLGVAEDVLRAGHPAGHPADRPLGHPLGGMGLVWEP